MYLEIAQANTIRSLGNDDETLASSGVGNAVTTITCALPSINRTAILAGIAMAICTYLVFHPSLALPADSFSAYPDSSSSSSSSSIPPPSWHNVQHQQVKTQIVFCVLAHTFVNRRYESAIAFAIRQAKRVLILPSNHDRFCCLLPYPAVHHPSHPRSWGVWSAVHFFNTPSHSIAISNSSIFSICQNVRSGFLPRNSHTPKNNYPHNNRLQSNCPLTITFKPITLKPITFKPITFKPTTPLNNHAQPRATGNKALRPRHLSWRM